MKSSHKKNNMLKVMEIGYVIRAEIHAFFVTCPISMHFLSRINFLW